MKRVEIEVDGKKLWFDWDEYVAQKEFMEQKEREYWEYVFSGQRTKDLFGEGAKDILDEQRREEEGD